MKKRRWLSLLVENEIGVLAYVSGLFSSKAYNLDSLTVGQTEDPSLSRMTVSFTSDDQIFEQIKKQLNRSVEVIKVVDFTNVKIHRKELMFVRVSSCAEKDLREIERIIEVFEIKLIDYVPGEVLIESVQTEDKNDDLINLLGKVFPNRIEVTRGGSVVTEALSIHNKSK